jgi:general stress protein 26
VDQILNDQILNDQILNNEEEQDLVGFLGSPQLQAILSTIASDGTIHSVMVNPFSLEGDTIGVFARDHSVKVKNLMARDQATIALVCGSKYLTLVGTAQVVRSRLAVEEAEARFASVYKRKPKPALDRVLLVFSADRRLPSRKNKRIEDNKSKG